MAEGSSRSLWLRWASLALVVIVALVIGSGLFDATAPTLAQRAANLDASLKCPSCQDLSVAESTSPSSLAVRKEVTTRLAAGQSDAEIVAALKAQYGQAVLLTPSGGLSTILWIVPALLAAGIVIAVVVVARRRGTSLRGTPRAPSEGAQP